MHVLNREGGTEPGTTEEVVAEAGTLDLPKASTTVHSHLMHRPISSYRSWYHREL